MGEETKGVQMAKRPSKDLVHMGKDLTLGTYRDGPLHMGKDQRPRAHEEGPKVVQFWIVLKIPDAQRIR